MQNTSHLEKVTEAAGCRAFASLPLLLAALLWAGGCSSSSPFAATARHPANQVTPSTLASQAGRAYPASGLGTTAQPANYPAGRAAPTNTAPSFAHQLMSAVRSTSDAIGEALVIEPTVIPATDPTSLAGQPVEVGGDLHFHAARVYESQHNFTAAAEHYHKALLRSPGDVKSLISLGRLYDRQGDLATAQGYYQQALQADPENCAALNDLGICYAKQGAIDAALVTLGRATQLQPANKRYRNNIATVLMDSGRTDEARQHLIAVHGQAAGHYNLGFMLLNRGMVEPARAELTTALHLNPYLQQARQLLTSLNQSGVPQAAAGPPASGPGSPPATGGYPLPARAVYPLPQPAAAGRYPPQSLPPL